MDEIENHRVPLILADPPYNKTQNKYDQKPVDVPELFKSYKRILKNGGVIALTSAEPFTSDLIYNNKKFHKFKYIWVKSKSTNFLNAKKQPLRKFEEVTIFYRERPTYNPQMFRAEPYDKGVRKDQLTGSYGDFDPVRVQSSSGERYPTDVLYYQPVEAGIDPILYFKTAESEIERTVWHPNQKPVALMEYMVNTYTNPGDWVIDNYAGVCTTGCACILANRHYTCMDNDQKWLDIGAGRVKFWQQEVNRKKYYMMSPAYRQGLPEYG